MQGFAYFPALVYRDERPDLVEEILPACIEHLNSARRDGQPMCQTGSVQHDPAFRRVADYLLLSGVEMLRDQGYAVERYDFYLAGLWVQETGTGSGTNVHVHKNSQVCGWMFVDAPQGGAHPVYHDTRMNKAMIELDFAPSDEVTNATSSIYFNNVQPGTVLFSNSWMQHQLASGSAETPTRSLHFIIAHKDRPCSTC
jgi:hypothetical protein